MSVTLSAQLATLPILVYHFNYLSIISIIANLLIIPVIGILISLTIGSIILGLISTNLATVFNLAINLLLKYVYKTAEICSVNVFSGITIEFVEIYHVIIYYVIIVISYLIVRRLKTTEELPLEDREQSSKCCKSL